MPALAVPGNGSARILRVHGAGFGAREVVNREGPEYRQSLTLRVAAYRQSNEAAVHLWEPSSLAIGCAAVVNRLAHFYLKICGVWIAAAARQIATKVCSHRIQVPQ